MNQAISPWMRKDGPENDIVLSTRIWLVSNFKNKVYHIIADRQELSSIIEFFRENYNYQSFRYYKDLSLIAINDLSEIQKMVLVEKHLISPYLAKSSQSGVLL